MIFQEDGVSIVPSFFLYLSRSTYICQFRRCHVTKFYDCMFTWSSVDRTDGKTEKKSFNNPSFGHASFTLSTTRSSKPSDRGFSFWFNSFISSPSFVGPKSDNFFPQCLSLFWSYLWHNNLTLTYYNWAPNYLIFLSLYTCNYTHKCVYRCMFKTGGPLGLSLFVWNVNIEPNNFVNKRFFLVVKNLSQLRSGPCPFHVFLRLCRTILSHIPTQVSYHLSTVRDVDCFTTGNWFRPC